MRPALARPLVSAGAAILLALTFAAGSHAENAQFDDAQGNSGQITAAEAADGRLPAKNLNSVPLDGSASSASMESSPLVRQLMAARPNEDLVICVAGCFSDRSRVVYARPIDRQARAKESTTGAIGAQSSIGASDGTSGSIAQSLRGTR